MWEPASALEFSTFLIMNQASCLSLESILEASKVVLLDTTNRPHLSNLGSSSNNLHADMRRGLDYGVLVVSKLWRRPVGIPLDIAWNQLVWL